VRGEIKVPADFSLYSHQVEMSLVPFDKSNLNDIPPELQIPYGKFVNFFLKKKRMEISFNAFCIQRLNPPGFEGQHLNASRFCYDTRSLSL
jgi:hypothetical protein